MLHFALLLAAQLAADTLPVGTYNGTCLYPQAVQDRADQGELVNCNEVEIAADHIAFDLRSWESRTRFNGVFQGDRMTVESVTLANGRTLEVRGVCELFYSDERLSTVACTAVSNRGAIAANFVVSRL